MKIGDCKTVQCRYHPTINVFDRLIYCPTNERLVTDLSPLWKPLCFFFLFLHYGLLALCSSFRFFPAGCSPCKLDKVEQSISITGVAALRLVPKQRPSTSVTSSLDRVANRSEQSSFSNKLPSAFTNLILLSYKTDGWGKRMKTKLVAAVKGIPQGISSRACRRGKRYRVRCRETRVASVAHQLRQASRRFETYKGRDCGKRWYLDGIYTAEKMQQQSERSWSSGHFCMDVSVKQLINATIGNQCTV